MKRSGRLLAAYFLVATTVVGAATVLVRRAVALGTLGMEGIEISSVVSPGEAEHLGWDMKGQFDITDNGLILLNSKGNIINVVTAQSVFAEPAQNVASFCAVGSGIVAICGNSLCAFNDGRLDPVVQIPMREMSLASSGEGGAFYLYGNTENGGDVYLVSAGGGYQKLLHTKDPILALAASNGRLFISSWSKILTWKNGEDPGTIVDLGDSAPVTSLAFDAAHGILYFSAGEGTFALAEGKLFLVMAGVSGDLKFSGDVLFVKDRVQHSILAATGVSEAVVNEWQKAQTRPHSN